jgi:hypothetical protein
VSQKSGLSPSITKGSSAIDLGKNSGVDMGRKSQPSLTSGGIGITQEVTNVGGMSVSVGGKVDVTPVDFGVSINPSEGTISVATEAEIPGGLLGISGGIEVDLNTGEVIGGSIGGEVGGFGINLSNSKNGGLGVEFTYQIGLIEFSVGFGFPPKKPKDPTTTPTTPIESESIPPEQPETKWTPPGGIDIESVRGCTLKIAWREVHGGINPYAGSCQIYMQDWQPTATHISRTCKQVVRNIKGLWAMQTGVTENIFLFEINYTPPIWATTETLYNYLNYIYYYSIPSSFVAYDWSLSTYGGGMPVVSSRQVSEPTITVFNCKSEKNPNIYTPLSNEKNTPPHHLFQTHHQ